MALGLAAVQQQVASSMQLKMQQSICQPVQLRTLCIITGKCRVRTQSFLDRPSINVTIVCASTNSSTTTSVRNKKKKKSAAADKPSAGGSSTAAAATATVTISANRADSIGTILTPKNPPLGFGNNIVPVAPLAGHAAAAAAASEDEDLDALDGLNYATGTGNPAAYRCLVLDSRYVPVNVISWPRAVVMGELGKAEVLEHHPGGFAYSAYRTHPLPAVLRVQTFVDVHEFAGKLTLTRKNVMLRDNHTCQYCGSSKDLTLDHIRPVCQGGVNSWTNLVTACMACNQKKGNKSLAQMGWNLPRVPREPTPQEVGMIAGLSKGDLAHPPLPWVPYLATLKAVLEKAQRKAASAAAATVQGSRGSARAAAVVAAAVVGDGSGQQHTDSSGAKASSNKASGRSRRVR